MNDSNFMDILKVAELDPLDSAPTTTWIDTGSLAFNALVSGSIFKGIPGNRTIMYAGAPSAGKSFLTLSGAKQFQQDYPDGQVVYFDTEFALEKDMLAKRDIDVNRFHIIQTDTLQDFRTKAIKFLESYRAGKNKPKVMMCLDSLSNLPTQKEVADALSGSEARDMTKAQVIRSIFRVLTNQLGLNDIPLVIANHVYSSMDMYSPVVISGGSGAIYAASTIITLNKSKDKDGTDVVGNIITATTYKSRYTKEAQKIKMRLDFETGLDRYYGLRDLAEKYEIFKKVSTRIELPDGSKVWGKDIDSNPEKYYTKDILERIDEAAKREYSLGLGEQEPTKDKEEVEDSE